MNIKQIVFAQPRTAKVQYLDTGIFFEVCFVSKLRFRAIAESCTTLQYDPVSKVHQPRIDTKKLSNIVTEEVVKGWSGMTPTNLSKLLPTDMSTLTPAQATEEIPFDVESLRFLMDNVHNLDSFLQDCATDAKLFSSSTAGTELAAKNSSSSSSGS